MVSKAISFHIILILLAAFHSRGDVWMQTDWSGGAGQTMWADSTMYYEGLHADGSHVPGDLRLEYPAWMNTADLVDAEQVNALIEGSDGALYAGTQGPSWNEIGTVFRSTDHGQLWANTAELTRAMRVEGLLESSHGFLYAATACSSGIATVFESTDWGGAWFRTGDLAGAMMAKPLLEGPDGALYVGTYLNGDVFKSTDQGSTWANTGELAGAVGVYSLVEASDSSLYAGTGAYGRLFKSTDWGANWHNIWEPPGATFVTALLETFDGWLYAATSPTGQVYRSADSGSTWILTGELLWAGVIAALIQSSDTTLYAGASCTAEGGKALAVVFKSDDAGTTWVRTGELVGAYYVWSLLDCSDGSLYAGTSPNGDVFRSCYFSSGYLTSSIYETGSFGANYEIMSWSETPNGQTLAMKVRTSPDSTMAGATPWNGCPPVANGQDISALSSVSDGDRYVQYRVELATSDLNITPVLHEVVISYSPVVSVEESSDLTSPVPSARLFQSRPNPFVRTTTISYCVPGNTALSHTVQGRGPGGHGRNLSAYQLIDLSIYDVAGRLVRTLVNGPQEPGFHKVVWDGRDGSDRKVSPGMYFCRLSVGNSVSTGKIVLMG